MALAFLAERIPPEAFIFIFFGRSFLKYLITETVAPFL